MTALLLRAGLVLAAATTALVWGVYAGRHDAFPAGLVIRSKQAIFRRLDPPRYWYRDIHDELLASPPMDCPIDPIVIVTGGQSNAANELSDAVDARTDLPAAMFYKGQCYPLADPLLGATGHRGSLWAALGHRLASETKRAVVFINGAITATTFEHWLAPDSGYLERLETAVREARAVGLKPHILLWHQGESDALARIAYAKHAERLNRLVTALLTRIIPSPDARLVLFRASVCTGARAAGNPELVAAQTEVASHHVRVVLGPDTDRLGARFRYDGCHFNDRGRDAVVEATLDVIRSLLAGMPQPASQPAIPRSSTP